MEYDALNSMSTALSNIEIVLNELVRRDALAVAVPSPAMQRVTFHIPFTESAHIIMPCIRRELMARFGGTTEIEFVVGWQYTPDSSVRDRQVLCMTDYAFTAQDLAWLKEKQEEWRIALNQKELYVTLQPITQLS